MPKVTVFLAAHNEQENIISCLKSLKFQTLKDFEIIFINDGSKDNTLELASEFLTKSELKYKLINLDTNRGRIYALNEAIKIADGEYIALMDADDTMYTDRLRLQTDFLNKNKKIDIVGGAQMLKFQGKQTALYPPKSHAQIITSMLTKGTMLNPTVMFRNDIAFREKKFLDPSAYLSEYYRFFVDAFVCNKKFANLQNILCDYDYTGVKSWELNNEKMKMSLISIFSLYLRRRCVNVSTDRLESLYKINTLNKINLKELYVFLYLQIEILRKNLDKKDLSLKIWFLQCIRAVRQLWMYKR